MAIFAVIDKTSFKARFNTGDNAFVDRVSSACVALNNMRFIEHSGLTTTVAGRQSLACRIRNKICVVMGISLSQKEHSHYLSFLKI